MKPLTEKCQWKGSVRDLTFVADYTFSLPFYVRQTEPVRIVCVCVCGGSFTYIYYGGQGLLKLLYRSSLDQY